VVESHDVAQAKDQTDRKSRSKKNQTRIPGQRGGTEMLPYTNPEVHYHIANDMKDGVSIYRGWPGEDLRDDCAYRVTFSLTSKFNLTHCSWESRTLFLGY